MGTDLSRIVSSEAFELVAENGKMRFFVHKEVLISQSEPFRNAITGVWKETTERKLNLNDWDGETVLRLIEFLYTGNYQYPQPIASVESQQGEETTKKDIERKQGEQEDASSTPTRPLTPLNEYLDPVFHEGVGDEADRAILAGFHPNDDYEMALLSHAKVYSLAQNKSVEALRTRALRRIVLVLLKIDSFTSQPDSRAALNFLTLAKYVYSSTDSLVSSEEPLRKIVSQVAARNIHALQTRQEMIDLMHEGGDFVTDLLPKITRMILGSPTSHEKKRIVPQPNPTIGGFDTQSVHSWREARLQTSKVYSFSEPYASLPGLPIGINRKDTRKNQNIRINAYGSNIKRDCFTINIDSRLDTQLHSAACSWLEIPSNDENFQFGSYCTVDGNRSDHTHTSRSITFPDAYAAPPTVVVMLASLEMEHHKNWRVKTYVTDVTEKKFVIHIDTWDDSILNSATATWIAYPTGMAKVSSGSYQSNDQPDHPPPREEVGRVNFENGVFTTGPRVLVAFNSIDIDCSQDLRLIVYSTHVTRAGMIVYVDNWANSVVYSVGVSYIALA